MEYELPKLEKVEKFFISEKLGLIKKKYFQDGFECYIFEILCLPSLVSGSHLNVIVL